MPAKPKAVKAYNQKLDLTLYFRRIKDATSYLGCNNSIIVKICKGKLESSWGWKFEYVDPTSNLPFISNEELKEPLQYDKKKIPWNKGKTGVYSEQALAQMSENSKGKTATEQTRRKMSESRKEYYKTHKHHALGTKLREEHKKAISKGLEDYKIKATSFNGESFKKYLDSENLTLKTTLPDEILINSHFKLELFCQLCNRAYETQPYKLVRGEGRVCKKCSGHISSPEIELTKYLKFQGVDRVQNNIKLKNLNGLELDIYLPEDKVAIEYHGLAHHSERPVYKEKNLNRIKSLHESKYLLTKSENIQLIQIFEDEWKQKPEIVKSIILNKLKKTPIKIYARNLRIQEIKTSESHKFFMKNHIAGSANAFKAFGLFLKDELVACLSLRKPFTYSYPNYLEIARFATKINTNIVGGFQKILKRVEEWALEHNYEGILSYADCRFGSGKVYLKAGFDHKGRTAPNYFYEKAGVRENRFKHRKVNDPAYIAKYGNTEREQNNNQGWYAIYDAGSEIYIKDLKK